ncbi:MAG: TolC family protein, partial [Elusimicrobiaceae bacterium]|nr:TolC family protein [Elusimicrobiaceae bacterium]
SVKDQIKAYAIALDGVQQEEALGNRTVLDVLDAYQALLNSNVEEVQARRNYYVSGMALLLSMGKLTAKDLGLNVDLYDAEKKSKQTRNKFLSLSAKK